MRARTSQTAAPLLALTVSLALLLAGCVAQDRPHVEAFFVVSDAGQASVNVNHSVSHREWPEDKAIEAEAGAAPHEEVEYAWSTSDGAHGSEPSFNISAPFVGLVLVELNVTAKNHTASDLSAVLFVPPFAFGADNLYLASVGALQLTPLAGTSGSAQDVRLGGHEGRFQIDSFSGNPTLRYRLEFSAGEGEVEALLLFAAKPSSGAARNYASPTLLLGAGEHYVLAVDASAAGADKVEVYDGQGTLVEAVPLSDFAAGHLAEQEAKVLVAPPGGTLPGFEGAAVASAVALASLLALRRRR